MNSNGAEQSGELVLQESLEDSKLGSQVDRWVKTHVELHQQNLVETQS